MSKLLFTHLTIIIITISLFSINIINAQTTNDTTNDPDLPSFTFLLTSLPGPERISICGQNKGLCASNCGGVNQDPKNFCNETTMGWGCGCLTKIPDLQPYQWSINYAHCINSGEKCKQACQSNNYTEDKKSNCTIKCINVYTNTCGTPNQPPAYYMVNDIAQIPTYEFNFGWSIIVIAFTALVSVASGMMIL
nr:542_t:CDS:2 [Entrophospora candida]